MELEWWHKLLLAIGVAIVLVLLIALAIYRFWNDGSMNFSATRRFELADQATRRAEQQAKDYARDAHARQLEEAAEAEMRRREEAELGVVEVVGLPVSDTPVREGIVLAVWV